MDQYTYSTVFSDKVLMPKSFDFYSKNYNERVNNAIRQTGYDVDNLVSAKLYKLRSLFPSLLEKPFRLLDFGCGVGNFYEHLIDYFPRATYTGVDPSKESIQQARSRFQTDLIFQESESIEWRSIQYDLIYASGVFHHIQNSEHASLIRELCALLRENGRLVIWEHNPLNPITQRIVKDCIFDRDSVLVSSKDLRKHFHKASLTNVQVIYTTFFPKFLSSFYFLDPYIRWLPLGAQYLVIGQKK